MNEEMSKIWVRFRSSYFPSEPWGGHGMYLAACEMGPKSRTVTR